MINTFPIHIAQVLNSSVGVRGNVGWRAGYIIDELMLREHFVSIFSRYSDSRFNNNMYGFNQYVHFSRFLNALRIYVYRNFDSRNIDNLFFSIVDRLMHSKFTKPNNAKKNVLHIWEFIPEIIHRYRRDNFRVILDIPIAPSLYSQYLNEKYPSLYTFSGNSILVDKERLCLQLADLIIAPSDFVSYVLEDFYHIPKQKIIIIPFGSEVGKNSYKVLNKTGIDFCFAGSINTRKGISILLNAWNDSVFKDDRLHLCGRLFPEMRDKIKESCGGKIILPGFVNTLEYFRNCDAYVFPSLLEGSSKSVYEALSAGLPVITTFNSGSIVRDKQDGFIIPIADPEALKDAMLKLKDSPELRARLGDSGRNFVKKFTWQKYASNIVDLYENI